MNEREQVQAELEAIEARGRDFGHNDETRFAAGKLIERIANFAFDEAKAQGGPDAVKRIEEIGAAARTRFNALFVKPAPIPAADQVALEVGRATLAKAAEEREQKRLDAMRSIKHPAELFAMAPPVVHEQVTRELPANWKDLPTHESLELAGFNDFKPPLPGEPR